MSKLSVLFILVAAMGLMARGQSVSPFVIASGGGYFSGTNAQLSWTLGEVATSTFTAGNSIVTQGFQQNTYVVIEIDELSENPYNLSVFPNPSHGIFNLKWENIGLTEFLINIANLQGVSVYKKVVKSTENQIEIDISSLSGATYIVYVSSTNGDWVKLFKIVKN